MRATMLTDKKKAFLIVTESFDIGGLETRIKVEVIAMLKAGHKVHLVCGENFNNALLPEGITSVTSHLKLSAEATSLELLTSVNSIREIISANNVDYLIVHPFSSLLPSVMAAELENIPCAITLHGPLSVGEMFGPIYEFIFFSIIIPSSSLIIAVSEEVKDLVTPHLGDRPVYVSPNTIDFNEFSPAADESASNDGRWILVSRLDEAKIIGIFDFIKKAKTAGISKIFVIGDGTAKPSLQDKLQANNLADLVEFTGFRTDVSILMQNAQGVAGMGRVALEGMASKKAVCLVGYDGVKGFVDDDLFEAAKYANFSGRNLSIVDDELFNTQYKKINKKNIKLIYNKSKLENSSFQQVANLNEQFTNTPPIQQGVLSDIYSYLKSDLIPNSSPILSSSVFFEKIGRLIFSKKYFNADLSSSYTFYQKKLIDSVSDNVGYYFRSQVEQKLLGIQNELQGSTEKIEELLSKQITQYDSEQVWQAKSAQEATHQLANQTELHSKIENLSAELSAAEQSKFEQIQIAANRERSQQAAMNNLQAEILQREQAWQVRFSDEQTMQNAERERLHNATNSLHDKIKQIEQYNHEQKLTNTHQQYTINRWQELACDIKRETDLLLKSKFWKYTSPIRMFNTTSTKLNELSYKIQDYSLKNLPSIAQPTFISDQAETRNAFPSNLSNISELTLDSRENMNNLQDLLALYGEDFLNESYRILLGRHADPQGLKHYISMLNIGNSKLELLLQISRSKEAKKYNANFPGLNNAISRHKLSKLPFCLWLTPNFEKIDNKMRMLENKLHELNSKKKTYSPSLNIESDKDRQNQIDYLNQIIAERDNELSLIKNNNSLDLTWEQFEKQVLAFRDDFKGIFVQELVIDWNVPLYQRPQHIASAFGRLGYLVIYKTANWGEDNLNGVRQVAHNVWMTSCWDANNISNAVHSIYSTAYFHQPDDIPNRAKDGVIIYEYIDHIDPQISGEGENIEKLLKLQEWAFNGGVDFVVASAKKLHSEAVEKAGSDKVILAQNGVDTRHYRNPIHQITTLPENLIAFRNKYQNIVGYFGALAPWLWYETITGLIKRRPDLGFVFIGPDYYGGVESLPIADNVLYLGVVDYKILPAYALQFDVCFIPFAPGEIAKTTSPLKLFEYFALEKPVVVTSEMAECVAFPEVFSGNSVATLSKAIDKAIAIKSDANFKKRLSKLADENDWDKRAKAMEVTFNQLKSKKMLAKI